VLIVFDGATAYGAGYTWVCSASAAQDRWSEVGSTLQATVATFRV